MHPTRLWRAQNASQEPETSFLIDPREQTALLRAIWAEGEELAGIFHSHPRSDPKPSERDRAIAAAQPRPLAWVIVGFPPCPEGCDGSEDRRCRTCGDWGYVPDLWVGQLPS